MAKAWQHSLRGRCINIYTPTRFTYTPTSLHEIYTPPIEQSDWSEFTTMVQVTIYLVTNCLFSF